MARRSNSAITWLVSAAAVCCVLLAPQAASAVEGDISTAAGTSSGPSGDGGLATAAQLASPTGVAPTPDGGLLIDDTSNHRVRKVSPQGFVSTVAGTTQGLSGDNGPATAAQLSYPLAVAPTPDGGFLIVDGGNYRIRKVSATGTITTVAGTTAGFSGDNGPATSAQLEGPTGVALTADGGYLIADVNSHRVRKVDAGGTITTVAGTTQGFGGDNGPATSAQLDKPSGVAATADGGFLIADFNNQRIRKVSAGGTITTVAGTTQGYGGDNGPATAAQLNQPAGVAVTADGGYLIAERSGHRIRKVSAAGTITTVAGDGTAALGGDGGPATSAQINRPHIAAPMPDGGFLIADTGNSRIRRVAGTGAPGKCGAGPFFVILGQASNDKLVGTELADAVLAGAGKDEVSGLGAGDCLLGQVGTDTLDGGAGDDRLDGGENADVADGGDGADTVIGDDGADTLTGGKDNDQLKGGAGRDLETGNTGADTVLGSGGADTLGGGSDGDRIDGGKGRDKLNGGPGNDRLTGRGSQDRLTGAGGKDKLDGGGTNDKLGGGPGRDKLIGGPGRDRLRGGRGRDRLIGGPGGDRIICGAGRRDVAVAGKGDRIAASCEIIR